MSASEVVEFCRKHSLTLGVAESCTGGMLGAELSAIPGASYVFQGGCITYSNTAKVVLLGVSEQTLTQFGAVSQEVAIEMATGVFTRLKVDLAVSITGIAGPGGSENKPEGRVCFAIATNGACIAETVEFGALGRKKVRRAATDHAIKLLQKSTRRFVDS